MSALKLLAQEDVDQVQAAVVPSTDRAYDRVTAALEKATGYRAKGNGGLWRCAAHDDRTPSLSVTAKDDRVLLHCHADCPTDQVLSALGLSMADLFDAPPDHYGYGPIEAMYDYPDEEGNLLFQVVRYWPKGFRQRRPNGIGGWDWSLDGTRRVLYRLPEVRRAVADKRTIYVVEGEKDADALRRTGVVATCNSGGAGKWRREHTEALAGAPRVVIVADKDEVGYGHARAVRDALRPIIREVTIVQAAVGKDAYDHLAAGKTLDELQPWNDGPESKDSYKIPTTRKADREMDAMDGADLLDRVEAFLARFVAYPSEEARVAHVLWVAHTHAMQRWESTPRLFFSSPEPASGKSRALEVTEVLVPRPVMAVNVSPAYLFHRVSAEDGLPTILYDEIDTVFGKKAKDNEDVRGLLNAGHRKGAVAGRCVLRNKEVLTQDFPAYCAVAMAGLGRLPETLMSRSVVVRMRRRRPDERVEAWRPRMHRSEGHAIRDALGAWAATIPADTWPEPPPGVTDRDADVWEALLAVADHAGGSWPVRARTAAQASVGTAKASRPSLRVRLLADLSVVFGDMGQMATEDILKALTAMEDGPWANLQGQPLDARGLANLLDEYNVRPKTVRIGGRTPRGYARADLMDPWSRYLPPAVADVVEPEPARGTEPDALTSIVADVSDVSDLQPSGGLREGNDYEGREKQDVGTNTDLTDTIEIKDSDLLPVLALT